MGIRLAFGSTSRLFPAGPVTVGRGTENDFSVGTAGIADRHAVFREIQGKWLVESVCGQVLTVGDGRPTRLAWLASGDRVRLAESVPELLFEVTATGPVDRPAAMTGSPAIPQGDRRSSPVPSPSRIPSLFLAGGGLLIALVVGALVFWRSQLAIPPVVAGAPSPDAPPSSPVAAVVSADAAGVPAVASPPTPEPPTPAVDPADFVVLVGIADIVSGNRPHLLGVGWLWNDRTVIVPRALGETVAAIVQKTRERGQPRSGCVIHGLPLPVESIRNSPGLSEVSILTLGESAGLASEPGRQWRRVGEGDIQRLRERREPLQYVSYARLPRPESVKGKHDFSLMAYDPEAVSIVTAEPRFEYEEHRHILKPDETNPVERGGLITDREGRIVGMVLLDAQVLWTADLERGLADLPQPQ